MFGTLISSVTVGAGGATTIDFTSIPATYTDLMLVLSLRDDAALVANSPRVRFNGDTGANYIYPRRLLGTGSAASSAGGTTGQTFAFFDYASVSASATTNTFSNAQIYIPNYAASTSKSFSLDIVGENNATASNQLIAAGLWSGTAAISSISIYNMNFLQYSSASLYGILKGSGGATVA